MSRKGVSSNWERGGDRSGLVLWLVVGVLASLGIHFAAWIWANIIPVERLSHSFYDSIVPRTFHVDRVDIDPRVFETAPVPEAPVPSAPQKLVVPEESLAHEKVVVRPDAAPPAQKLPESALSEPDPIETASLAQSLESAFSDEAQAFVPDDKALAEALLKDRPILAVSSRQVGSEAVGTSVSASRGGSAVSGFSDLDALLARTGPLTPGTAPILMPSDLLFDYDNPDLLPEAVSSLEKLATLIRRSPGARFIIEGHTDSFGPDDYNLLLSQKRAESVKNWLTVFAEIPPEAIETRGLGKSRPIAPPTGTIPEQQLNRRVEIVIQASQP